MGIFFPVFIATFENPINRELLITGIKYEILDVIDLGGPSALPPDGPLTPTVSYTHNLTQARGDQLFTIAPSFRIGVSTARHDVFLCK